MNKKLAGGVDKKTAIEKRDKKENLPKGAGSQGWRTLKS